MKAVDSAWFSPSALLIARGAPRIRRLLTWREGRLPCALCSAARLRRGPTLTVAASSVLEWSTCSRRRGLVPASTCSRTLKSAVSVLQRPSEPVGFGIAGPDKAKSDWRSVRLFCFCPTPTLAFFCYVRRLCSLYNVQGRRTTTGRGPRPRGTLHSIPQRTFPHLLLQPALNGFSSYAAGRTRARPFRRP